MRTIVGSSEPVLTLDVVRRNFEESGITVEVSARDLARVQEAMQSVLDASERAVALVRELAGPQPGPVPQHLVTVMLMGTGYFRAARDTLRALFRARNARRRERKKEAAQ